MISRPRTTRLVVAALLGASGALASCSLLVDTGGFSSPVEGGSSGADATSDATSDAASPADAEAGFPLGCDAPGLVAAWRFEEGRDGVASDCTGHGFDAPLGGDAGWAAGHDGGAALALTGGGWAECAKPAELRFAGALSITAWVLLTSLQINGRVFASARYPSDLGFELTFEMGEPGGRQRYWSFIVATAPDGGITADGPGGVVSNVWTHLAAVYDGSSALLYVDGALEATTKLASARQISSQPFYIGRRSDSTCCFFTGFIDDLRVYSRVLPAAEVRALSGR